MTNALAVTNTPFAELMVQGETLVKSGFLPSSVKTKEQAVAIMTMGQEIGIGMWAAFNGINVISGKPTISPQLMLALIRRSGQLEDMDIKDDGNTCFVMMKRKGTAPHTETFSADDAARMTTTEWEGGTKKTIKLSEKYNWKSMPKVMRKWRAVSACARIVFPDVIIGFYTPEEIDPDVSIDFETGEITERPSVDPKPEIRPVPAPVIEEGVITDETPKTSEKPTSDEEFNRAFPPRTAAPDTIPGVSKGVPNVADITDLYDLPMTEALGEKAYRIRQYSMANSNTRAERHWKNRLNAHYGNKELHQLGGTVREFVEKMATSSSDTEAEAA